MGTRTKPGKFDCYHKAEPDEPVFVLLARDPSAAKLVYAWAWEREQAIDRGKAPESDREKVAEARVCGAAMDAWYMARPVRQAPVSPPQLHVVKAEDLPVAKAADIPVPRGPYVPPTPETERAAATEGEGKDIFGAPRGTET